MRRDDPLLKILRVCATELADLDADWAVGGAVAMAAYGFTRETEDVDVFIGDDVRDELLDRLRERGFDVAALMAPVHYTVTPNAKEPGRRVDLLFPSAEPDVSAIMGPASAKIAGRSMPIWPLHLIVANKLIADRPKDRADLLELRARDLVDVNRVADVLLDMKEREALGRLKALRTEPDRPRPRPRRRID